MRTHRVGHIGKLSRMVALAAAVAFGLSGCISVSMPSVPKFNLFKMMKFGKSGKSGGSNFINQKTKFSVSEYGVAASPRLTTAKKTRKGGGRRSLGKRYKVRGKWYTPTSDPNYDKKGTASWYGPNFHGRLTANGEIYDMNMPSAAHKTLPLPSYVRVTNLSNGRHMVVRVNDRGPYVHKREIDLSAKAAELLGFKGRGTAKVRVQYLRKAPLEGDDTAYLMATLNKKQNEKMPSVGLAGFAFGMFADAGKKQVKKSLKPILAPMLKPVGGLAKVVPSLSDLGDTVVEDLVDSVVEGEFSSDGGRFGAGFSYAGRPRDVSGAYISDAHSAIEQALVTNGTLADWSARMDVDKRHVDILLGTFANNDNAERLGLAFARLAAVDLDVVGPSDKRLTQVRVRYLKVGVSRSDIVDLAEAHGIALD